MPHPSSSVTDHPPSLIRRVRHELVRREVTVSRSETLCPGLQSITFAGASLRGFTSLSFDDHVKFMFTDSRGQEQRRDYTPRHFDPARLELTLVFALHDGGAASDWARHARPGDTAVIGGPRGSMIIPDHLDWYFLAGDATAWPAIARRLEELPAAAKTVVLLQTRHPEMARALPQRPGLQLQCVDQTQDLIEATRRVALPPGRGFAWCAGEASAMVPLRDVLLADHGLARTHLKASAYWKAGVTDFHDDLS